MGPRHSSYGANGISFLSCEWNRGTPLAGVAPTYQTSRYSYNCTTTTYVVLGYNVNR